MPTTPPNTLRGHPCGKDKGITVYSFISEHYPVFYTTVFSSGDYEACGPSVRYVLDGLLHNALSMPNEMTHSTDTHGVTELNFALTYLLGIAFQRQRPTVSH